ncbi:MAG: type VII secretion protein EssC, partial [Oscillospiraceae bacterium]
ANSMVCQIAALHCYTDVKIGFIMNTWEMNLYSWVKWLPHTLFQKDKLRLVGCGDTSLENVMYAISAELGHRAELSSENKGMIIPHIVIFCSAADIMQNSILSRYMTSQEYLGVTFVLLYGEMNKLPNECKAIIECSDDFQGFYLLDGEITEENKISFDMIKTKDAELFARKISGFYVNEISTGEVPSNVGYFEMLGIGRIESWDLIRHYKENRSYEGLKALIGEGIGSRPVFLDIHDKKHGPHGLVAGTTGSGKSETLQTFILSLAMNYSPDDITFVLIDYKGGGMANVFNGLPHIAGMITNLSDEANGEIDRSITRRACSSLKSEIKRRQTVFGKYKVNHIDTYSRLYREGKADEAIPHLVIISDEFAELKKEQPEFIRELISVARVGRSLGIHLILATQKPSGVVDDEIWSNSRFKICLRVQDKQDSTSMLKRSDAAYITEAGRAYLQVGNDEIFELFQSGYSGEGYIPKDKFVSAADSEAVMIDIDGNNSVIHNRKSDSNAETELEAAVKYISTVSAQYKINSAKPLWLPALDRKIILDDIEHGDMNNHNGITAVYGIIDNHEKQRQYPAAIDISCCSNLKIAGASGSGKTTLLQTLLVSIVKKYTPEQVNFYVMDFSSRTFKTFRNLPHCGGVVFEEENDAVERLLKLMFDIIEERRILFGNSNVGSYNEYVKLNSLPLILLVIDNFCAFSESYEKYIDILIKLVHEGTKYGIQTIITVNNSSELKYKLRNYINSSIVLHLAEKSEYSEYIGRTPEYVPVSVSGRGLTVSEGSVLEYQTALPIYGENEFERSANLKKLFSDINHKYADYNHAKVIPFISPDVKFNDLLEVCNESNALTIGYNFENLEPYNISFADFYCYCISSSMMNGISLVMKNIGTYAEKNNISLGIVKLNDAVEFENKAEYVYSNTDEIQELVKLLHKEFSERNAAVADWNSDNAGLSRDEYIAKKFGRLFIVIDDMTKFCEAIYNPPFDRGSCELIEYFLKEGKNHAVHFFAGYDSTHKTYSETSRVFKSENHGIHLGGKTIEQNALEINIPPADKMKELGSNIGYCVENKSVVTVFVPEN